MVWVKISFGINTIGHDSVTSLHLWWGSGRPALRDCLAGRAGRASCPGCKGTEAGRTGKSHDIRQMADRQHEV